VIINSRLVKASSLVFTSIPRHLDTSLQISPGFRVFARNDDRFALFQNFSVSSVAEYSAFMATSLFTQIRFFLCPPSLCGEQTSPLQEPHSQFLVLPFCQVAQPVLSKWNASKGVTASDGFSTHPALRTPHCLYKRSISQLYFTTPSILVLKAIPAAAPSPLSRFE